MSTIAELKLIVDTAQLESATKALDDFNASAGKVGSSGDKITKAFKEAGDESSEFTNKQQRLIDKAKEMVETFDKGQSGVLSYRANLVGVGDVVDPLVKKFDNLKNTQKDVETVNKEIVRSQQQADAARLRLIGSLQEEIALFGKSKEEIKLYQAEQMGILDTVKPLVEELQKLKQAKVEADSVSKEALKAEREGRKQNLDSLVAEREASEARLEQGRNRVRVESQLLAYEKQRAEVSKKALIRDAESQELRNMAEAHKKNKEEVEKEAQAIKDLNKEFLSLRGQIDPTKAAYEKLYAQLDKIQGMRKQASKKGSLIDLGELDELENTVNANIKQMDTLGKTSGKTAKEIAFAMRGLPAQFTDIVVSLQAGQRPLSVLLQQGGQIKDMFGGIGVAARAMGGYILGLITPANILVAVTAGLAYAWYSGGKEADRFNKTLISTGQSAKYTSGELSSMSANLSNSYTTIGRAAEVLNQVVAAGDIHRDNLETVTRATLDWSATTGTAVDDVISDFSSLAKDPVRALNELQEKYKFLTIETYNAAKAQIEIGNKTEATRILTEQLATTMQDRSEIMIASLSGVNKALFIMKNLSKDVVDYFKNINRDTNETMASNISEKYMKQFEYVEKMRDNVKYYEGRGRDKYLERLSKEEDELEKLASAYRKVTEARIKDDSQPYVDASINLDERHLETLSEEARIKLRINEAEAAYADLRKKGTVTSEQERKHKEIMKKLNRDLHNAEENRLSNKALEASQDRLALAKEQYSAEHKITAETKEYHRQLLEMDKIRQRVAAGIATEQEEELNANREIILSGYKEAAMLSEKHKKEEAARRAAAKDSVVRNSAAETSLKTMREQQGALEEQLATDVKLGAEGNKLARLRVKLGDIELKAKTSVLTKEEQSLLLAKDELLAQQKYNVSLEERIRLKETEKKVSAYKDGLDASIKTERERIEDLKTNLSLSDKMRARQQELVDIERERAKAISEAAVEFENSGNEELYDAKVEALEAYYDRRLELSREYYEQEDALKNEWQDAFFAGLNNYIDNQKSIFDIIKSDTESIINDLDAGVRDSIVQTIMYGDSLKEQFHSLAMTITEKVLGSLVDIGVQLVINAGREKAIEMGLTMFRKTQLASETATALAAQSVMTTSAVTQAAIITSAYTPAAIAASIATSGGAATAAMAQFTAATGAMTTSLQASRVAGLAGFKSGGYTGNVGVNDVAGVVHGQEFVFDAASTQRIGVDNLERMRNGGAGVGGDTNIITNISVTASDGVSDEDARRQGVELAEGFEGKVLSIIARQRQAGGMLSNV